MSTKYVHFTDEQKELARQTDLCELLRSQGEKLKRSGSEYEWWDGSQKVTIRGNLWFHQYDRQGGDAIDFVRRFYNKDYPEAVEYLLGSCNGTLTVSPPIERRPQKPFELPPRNDNMRRVYAYLLSRRGLDRDVVYAFAHRQMIYESAQYHNAVFVGFDQDGVPRHANMRGTGSDIQDYFTGNHSATHHIAYQEMPVLTPIRVLASSRMDLPMKTWEHLNVYECPYRMRFEAAEVFQIVICYEGRYHRCVKSRFQNLCYDGINDDWHPVGTMFFGNGCVMRVCETAHQTRLVENILYVQEESAEDSEMLIQKLEIPAEVIFDRICDEIFGDG